MINLENFSIIFINKVDTGGKFILIMWSKPDIGKNAFKIK